MSLPPCFNKSKSPIKENRFGHDLRDSVLPRHAFKSFSEYSILHGDMGRELWQDFSFQVGDLEGSFQAKIRNQH